MEISTKSISQSQMLKDQITDNELKQLKGFCKKQMDNVCNPAYIIHNWAYTQDLVKTAEKLMSKEGYSDEDKNLVRTILYFYNLGYISEPEDPLKKSADLAKEYLIRHGYSEKVIKKISAGIGDTIDHKSVSNPIAAAAQDALYSHYGKKKLKKFLKNGLEEYNVANKSKMDEIQWFEKALNRMMAHRFNLKTASEKWSDRKVKNIKKLRREVYQLKKSSSLTYNKRAMTMFKTASRNQIDLVNIADKKAGIMITVNAILITILLPLFASYIIDLSQYLIPAIILMVTCGVSIVLATLATKPVSRKDPTSKDFSSGNSSLFWFRNFIKLNKDEYKTAIHDLIVKDVPFENAVITDLYDLGTTLGVKYKKLTYCYWVFAVGIGLTIISLIGCMLYFGQY